MSFRGDKGHVEDRIHALPCWSGPVEIEPLGGGLTNLNFRVTDGGKAYVARTAADIPELFVYRWHEALACDAAHMAGIAPAVIFRGDGIMITDFVAGRTLSEVDIRSPRYIERIAPLLKRAHTRGCRITGAARCCRSGLSRSAGPSPLSWRNAVVATDIAGRLSSMPAPAWSVSSARPTTP